MKLTNNDIALLRTLDAHKIDGYEASVKEAKVLKKLMKLGLAELKLTDVDEDIYIYFITQAGVSYVKRLPNHKS